MSSRDWTLFWRDRNQRWHRYDYAAPTADITTLLDGIDRAPTGIFWGHGRATAPGFGKNKNVRHCGGAFRAETSAPSP